MRYNWNIASFQCLLSVCNFPWDDPIFLPPPSSHPLPSGGPHTAVCVHGSCMYVPWLIPSPSVIQSSLPSPLTAVSLFHVPTPVSILLGTLFCSFDTKCKWNHMAFVFDWFISHSIIVARSTHAVAKGKISFFLWLSSIPLCKCTTAFLSTCPCIEVMGT